MKTDRLAIASVAWAAFAAGAPLSPSSPLSPLSPSSPQPPQTPQTPQTPQKGTFSLNVRSRAITENQMDGQHALRKTYLKYGFELPEHLQEPRPYSKRQLTQPPTPVIIIEEAQTNETGSTTAASQQNDLEYLSPVKVGNTLLNLDFDTGSSDLWVFSDMLPASQRGRHNYYSTGSNCTGHLMEGFSWDISYGDGSGAKGVVYADKVQIGGATATTQAVEVATSISAEFVNEYSDGLLGLGFGVGNTIRPTSQPTFFQSVSKSLDQPLFTVSLKKNATGQYDFGYIDQDKYVGELQYIPINNTRSYWEFEMTGYIVGNTTETVTPTSIQAIADTGTTLMLLPQSVVDAYYKQVPGAQSIAAEGGYVFPCNSALPDLKMWMDTLDPATDKPIVNGTGAVVVVPGEYMNRSLSDTGSGKCFGGLQVGPDYMSIWGDVFLKSQFVVFDAGSGPNAIPRLGVAPQKLHVNNTTVPSTTDESAQIGTGKAVAAAAQSSKGASTAPLVAAPLRSIRGLTRMLTR